MVMYLMWFSLPIAAADWEQRRVQRRRASRYGRGEAAISLGSVAVNVSGEHGSRHLLLGTEVSPVRRFVR
jgi:hypothetical protein